MTNGNIAIFFLFVLASATCPLPGCTMRDKDSPMPASKGGLTPEAARTALISMVEAGQHADLKMALPRLRSDPIRKLDGNRIEIGRWRCNLERKTFSIDVDAGPIFAEYSGVFSLTKTGEFQAAITSEAHN